MQTFTFINYIIEEYVNINKSVLWKYYENILNMFGFMSTTKQLCQFNFFKKGI